MGSRSIAASRVSQCGDQLGYPSITRDSAEVALGFEHAGRGPAQNHRAACQCFTRHAVSLTRLNRFSIAPGEWQTTFRIITTSANRLVEPIHTRMPVILDETAADDWMNPREPDPHSLERLLVPAADDLLVVRPASPLVNSAKNEGQ